MEEWEASFSLVPAHLISFLFFPFYATQEKLAQKGAVFVAGCEKYPSHYFPITRAGQADSIINTSLENKWLFVFCWCCSYGLGKSYYTVIQAQSKIFDSVILINSTRAKQQQQQNIWRLMNNNTRQSMFCVLSWRWSLKLSATSDRKWCCLLTCNRLFLWEPKQVSALTGREEEAQLVAAKWAGAKERGHWTIKPANTLLVFLFVFFSLVPLKEANLAFDLFLKAH